MDHNTARRLKELILEAEKGEARAKEVLQGYIEKEIISKDKALDHPPLLQLAYVTKELIQPDLLYDEVLNLLNVLAQIEHTRILAEEQAQIALELNSRYKKQGKSGVKLLKKNERKQIEGLLSGKIVVRQIYIGEIVLPLYQLYIHYLWTSPHFVRLTKVMRLFFPSLFVKTGDPLADDHWKQPLHRNFSVDERERVHQVGLKTKAFLADARAWDLERKASFEKLGVFEEYTGNDEDYVEAFEAQFPRSVDEKVLEAITDDYLKLAQNLVELLENLFPRSAANQESKPS